MKITQLFSLVLLLVMLPITSMAAELNAFQKAQEDIDTLGREFRLQLGDIRTDFPKNSTVDLVETGVHNLRTLRAQLSDACARMQQTMATEGANESNTVTTVADLQQSRIRCDKYAEEEFLITQAVFKGVMSVDLQQKKSTLFEQRLKLFNDHIREILEMVISIRGAITKVQQNIDFKAKDTEVQ